MLKENRIEISVSQEVLRDYYFSKYYYQSLIHYQEYYAPLIFNDANNIPPHQLYLCPLCLKNYILTVKNDRFYVLTDFNEDHYPPDSAGGKNKMLVCKPCNNKAGYAFDFAMKEHLEVECFERKIPNAEKKVTASIDGLKGNFKAVINVGKEGNLEFSLNPRKNKYIEEWQKTPEAKKASITFNIKKYDKADTKKVQKAFLKTAYLYCFSIWGYDFAFSRNGEKIRKVLNDEIEYPISILPNFWIDDLYTIPAGVCLLQIPDKFQTHIVNIPLVSKELDYKVVASVILPTPTEDGWEALPIFDTALKNWEKLDVGFLKIDSIFE